VWTAVRACCELEKKLLFLVREILENAPELSENDLN
jgi:hypothetical protein